MTIEEITNKLINGSTPGELGEYYTILSGWYSFYGEKMKKIKLLKPTEWLLIKKGGEKISDKLTDTIWEATENGQKEIALTWELKRIEQMMKAINSRLYIENIEAKNQVY